MSRFAPLLYSAFMLCMLLTIGGMGLCVAVWPLTDAYFWPMGVFGGLGFTFGVAIMVIAIVDETRRLRNG